MRPSAELVFTAPQLLVGSGANQAITTTGGGFTFNSAAPSAALPAGEQGGAFALTARSVTLASGTTIQALAGNVSLTATSGDLRLNSNARIQAGGFVSTFFDVSKAIGGGSVRLFANAGTIDLDPTARIDVSSPVEQPGLAGQIGLTAPNGSILSAGGAFNMAVIAGSVAGDSGGRPGASTPQSLGANAIALPGMFDASIDLRLGQGNILLASDIRAAAVTITADGGSLTVGRTIDSSGVKGGTISLFGRDGVILTSNARLLATASDADERGGDVLIGTRGTGVLDLQGGAIDVSNTANAANGGTVRLRAPLIGAGLNDVAIRSSLNPSQDFAIQTAINLARLASRSKPIGCSRLAPRPVCGGFVNGIIDPVANPGFFGSCNGAGVCTGTLVEFVENFSAVRRGAGSST